MGSLKDPEGGCVNLSFLLDILNTSSVTNLCYKKSLLAGEGR